MRYLLPCFTHHSRRCFLSMNVQAVQFRDKNRLAHDLDTQTFGVNANLSFPWNWQTSLGGSRTQTKDKVDGSQRTGLTASASCTVPLSRRWSSQYWGSLSQSRNTSPLFPSDARTLSVNSEFTWTPDKSRTLAFGPGYNDTKDRYSSGNSHHELVLATRYSYSF